MTDIISYGGKEYSVTPMSLVEALEVMFILKPYAPELVKHKIAIDVIGALLKEIQANSPADLMRVLAYMLHADAEELISDEVIGAETVLALTIGLQVNSIVDLLDMAFLLGITNVRWSHGD